MNFLATWAEDKCLVVRLFMFLIFILFLLDDFSMISIKLSLFILLFIND